jgi:hypothetical protein
MQRIIGPGALLEVTVGKRVLQENDPVGSKEESLAESGFYIQSQYTRSLEIQNRLRYDGGRNDTAREEEAQNVPGSGIRATAGSA